MSLKDFFQGPILLLDAEFTCWENSLISNWNNPKFPAEMIEIGMIAYDPIKQVEISSYTSLVKPQVNPILSTYCLNTVPITQAEVDSAPDFDAVVAKISAWLSDNTLPDSPTASWGRIDREHTKNQAIRNGVVDPFSTRPHIQVDELVKTSLEINKQIEREDVRKILGIQTISGRHRALADSADLIAFDHALDNKV